MYTKVNTEIEKVNTAN